MRAAARLGLAAAALAGCGGGGAPARPRPATTTAAAHRPAPRARVSTTPAAMAARAHVPVLCWHQVRDPTAADGPQARPYIVAPAVLDRQLGALQRAGYRAVSAEQLVAHVRSGAPLPPRPVLLTFDDGSAGQYAHALPILRRHHMTATFFVMTVVLDKPGWLRRAQVRALDRAGMTIAAHTWDHRPVPQLSGEQWPQQLVAPRRELEHLVGHRVRLFAYPYGEWTPRAFVPLRAAGYEAAFQLADRLDRAHPLLTLRRIIVPSWSGRELLAHVRGDFS